MQQNGKPASRHGIRSDDELHLRDLVNLLRRNVWLIGGIAAAVIGGTAWVTWTTPPVYEGRTTIHVDASRSPLPDLDFLSGVVRGSDVETEMALLRARSIAAAAVDSLTLQVTVREPVGRPRSTLFSEISATATTREGTFRFQADGDGVYRITDSQERPVGTLAPGEAIVFNGLRLVLHPAPEEPLPSSLVIATQPRQQAVDALLADLSVGRPYRDANVIAVGYHGTDPEMVMRVPNTVASIFIARRSAMKKTEARSTVEFLTSQIESYTEDLRLAEENVLAFRQGEQVVNLEAEGSEQVRRLVEEQARRDQISGELEGLNEILDEIERTDADPLRRGENPYRRLAAFPTFLQNQAVTELMSELNRIETELQDQLTRRTVSHPDVQGRLQGIRQLEAQLHQLAVNYRSTLRSQIASATQRLAQFGSQLEAIPQKELQQARLERQQEVLEQVFTLLQNRLKEAEIAQAVEPGDVRVVDEAGLPTRPIRPRKTRSMVLAVIFGLVLGVGVAAGKDYMDETVRSREELTRIADLPVLGMIPRIRGTGKANGKLRKGQQDHGGRLVTRNDVSNPVSEAYRAFRTNITFLGIDEPPRVLVLTSPGPGEGKSTSTVNLAITLAQQGTRTLVVDCDLRRGILHKVLGESDAKPGLTNVIMNECELDDAVRSVEVADGKMLDLLPTGTLPPNPSELVGSQHMRRLLAELRERYEMVLLDSPPLNLVTDAAVLGAEADGVILIARAGATDRGALRFALDQLEAVNAKVKGTVLNDLDYQGRGRYYGSGAGYGYYHRYYRAETRT
ncbi:MAG: polysaccharide biosynthesis tyrosine autokinase [Gemmatimonadetes bacterium]|nr:polysaccharide biosynthesis tyrosine autokinase [Gemmatimonadota bacterium]